MIRKFEFEADIYESLNCLPMAARRKLDALKGPEQRNPKAVKLEQSLKKVKKREEGSVV